jgi:hypothetical protein
MGGVVPAKIAASFRMAELAVLTVVARQCGVSTRSVKNRTLSRQSNEISGLKSKAFAYRGGLLGTRHRHFPFQHLDARTSQRARERRRFATFRPESD